MVRSGQLNELLLIISTLRAKMEFSAALFFLPLFCFLSFLLSLLYKKNGTILFCLKHMFFLVLLSSYHFHIFILLYT
jgi:hypothetical protein